MAVHFLIDNCCRILEDHLRLSVIKTSMGEIISRLCLCPDIIVTFVKLIFIVISKVYRAQSLSKCHALGHLGFCTVAESERFNIF